ncbi:MAG: hypothetical protein ACRD8A_07345 [Candidatus Acidiferrales bacterium]
MQLTPCQQTDLREHGVRANEACDKCRKILGAVRFTRRGEAGEWCSELCRDGAVIDHGARRNLRKRMKQAASMNRSAKTGKSMVAAPTNQAA